MVCASNKGCPSFHALPSYEIEGNKDRLINPPKPIDKSTNRQRASSQFWNVSILQPVGSATWT